MMEKHKCKICYRNFANGRALGGHMRSHMMNLPVNKPTESPPRPATIQLSFEAESASSQSFEDNYSKDLTSLSYGLRENPKKSFRVADPEFSFAGAAVDAASVVDRESETESSKNVTRKRSKRAWKLSQLGNSQQIVKKPKQSKNESASSVSDTTTEEDIAFCLIMMSRDRWKKQEREDEEIEEEDEEEEEDVEEEEEEEDSDEYEETNKLSKTVTKVRGKYKCEACNKVFRSYQALGGHRASHKKIKVINELELDRPNNKTNNNNNNYDGEASVPVVVEKKIHECPVCFRVFASGQALGGHKRTHVTGSVTANNAIRSSVKFRESSIDLNLPAPMDDDDVSQFEDSAVSDAEFVK